MLNPPLIASPQLITKWALAATMEGSSAAAVINEHRMNTCSSHHTKTPFKALILTFQVRIHAGKKNQQGNKSFELLICFLE